MANDSGNEDNWLYGDSNSEAPDAAEKPEKVPAEALLSDAPPGTESEDAVSYIHDITSKKSSNFIVKHQVDAQEFNQHVDENIEPPGVSDDLPPGVEPGETEKDTAEDQDPENSKENGDGSDKQDSDDDSDDDVNVVIGDIKTSPAYTSLNMKRPGMLTANSQVDKLKQTGKFSIDEFEQIGTINGVQAQDYNLDCLEDKPWRKPGADITDYFNYGFNEDTWRAYCERQKRMRVHESGVGLAPMNAIGLPRATTSITNENSKYSGNFTGPRKAGPPPGRRMTGSIDVIGGTSGVASRRGLDGTLKGTPPKENVIQVMTADRREYSRKPAGFPDMSVPPPGAPFDPVNPMTMPPPTFDGYQGDFFNPEPEPYYGNLLNKFKSFLYIRCLRKLFPEHVYNYKYQNVLT